MTIPFTSLVSGCILLHSSIVFNQRILCMESAGPDWQVGEKSKTKHFSMVLLFSPICQSGPGKLQYFTFRNNHITATKRSTSVGLSVSKNLCLLHFTDKLENTLILRLAYSHFPHLFISICRFLSFPSPYHLSYLSVS